MALINNRTFRPADGIATITRGDVRVHPADIFGVGPYPPTQEVRLRSHLTLMLANPLT